MKIVQLTHHDLDGYGASAVVGAYADVSRVVHIARYSDVGPVVEAELARLKRSAAAEMLIMTDLGLEAPTVTFIKEVAAMNGARAPETRHRLVVLDHHASSVGQLAAQGLRPAPGTDEAWPSLKRYALSDAASTVLIDESRCATRMASDHRDLYGTAAPGQDAGPALPVLVDAIDAVDLWAKERPIFRQALVLDEVFWDNVSGFIPLDHPWHERFVGRLLLGMASLLGGGAVPAAIERETGALRARVIDEMLAGQPGDDPDQTTRMRLAPVLARAPELFRRLSNGAKLSFGLDSGTFQRVSDAIMVSRDAAMVINVQRSGSVSVRSTDQTALDLARKLRGGGHKDAAGGRLPNGAVASLADAVAQIEAALAPPKKDVSNSPFAALKDFKA